MTLMIFTLIDDGSIDDHVDRHEIDHDEFEQGLTSPYRTHRVISWNEIDAAEPDEAEVEETADEEAEPEPDEGEQSGRSE